MLIHFCLPASRAWAFEEGEKDRTWGLGGAGRKGCQHGILSVHCIAATTWDSPNPGSPENIVILAPDLGATSLPLFPRRVLGKKTVLF